MIAASPNKNGTCSTRCPHATHAGCGVTCARDGLYYPRNTRCPHPTHAGRPPREDPRIKISTTIAQSAIATLQRRWPERAIGAIVRVIVEENAAKK